MPCRAHKARLAARERAREAEASNSATTTAGAATATATATAQPSTTEASDIRELSSIERRALGEGTLISVFAGPLRIIQIPKRLFLASSSKASELLNGFATEIRLPEVVDTAAILRLVSWLTSVTQKANVPVFIKSTELTSNIRLCRVARIFGMSKYVQHIHNYCWAQISNLTPDKNLLTALETLADPDDDSYVICAAKRLRNLVRTEKMSRQDFDVLVEDCPKVSAAVDALNEEKGSTW